MNQIIQYAKSLWQNKVIRNTLAGIGGYLAGRAYPRIKDRISILIEDARAKMNPEKIQDAEIVE